ncbi:MAG: hypothetical protein GY827_07150 [Cytophagales bacterium]|nr:hypothetical protein [Cytophagales bacterium]
MVRFFKLNDPFRLVVVFIILLLVRLPFWLLDTPLLSQELSWMLVGEKLNEGLVVYRDFKVMTAPLSSFFYGLMDWFFGRSSFAYQLLAFGLMYLQCVLFNYIVNRAMAFSEKTYLPAIIYGIASSFFIDCFTLNPVLLAITFLLLALGEMFFIIKSGRSNENVFYMGFYLGLTVLFYPPSFLFVIVFLLSSLLYTNVYVKGYLVFAFGLFFPLLLFTTYYYWVGGLNEFFTSFFIYFGQQGMVISFLEIIAIMGIPSLFLLFSILRTQTSTRFVNYQMRFQSVMLLVLFIGVGVLFITPQLTSFHFMIFVPVIAYFVSAFFMLFKSAFFREMFFVLFLFCFVTTSYSYTNTINQYVSKFIKHEKWLLEKSSTESYGKILVLGKGKQHYLNNEVATIYLDWNLSQDEFIDLDNYENISHIYTNFQRDLPGVIIDEQNIIPKLFERIPEFALLYEKKDSVYFLNKSILE